jgi:diguanylate cyclase (GGDEF)-like protein
MTTPSPLRLKPNSAATESPRPPRRNWRVLVVDDDGEVHAVTRMILSKFRFQERGVELLSAFSAAEARDVLTRETDIAVILLDVVMESDDAGLQLVRAIREDLGNEAVRIILRTGQPGQAPEEKVIVDYDINDYKAKSELTAQKLFTAMVTSLRSYQTIMSLERNRRGLEKILDSSSSLFQVTSIQNFASGVLTQLSAFMECRPNGIICAQVDESIAGDHHGAFNDMTVLASTDEYRDYLGGRMDDDSRHQSMVAVIRKALTERRNQMTDEFTVLYLDTGDARGTVALLHGGGEVDKGDAKLLEVFSSKISIALANAIHYQKMVSAETAATTDFLTKLNNRRQLLRLGIPLVAGAYRTATPLAVAVLDIDHFKRINDTWGHDAGDEVLVRVGALIRERFRTSDVTARFGGEEFCVVASNVDHAQAVALFDAFRQALADEVFDFGGTKVKVTVSIGVTTMVADNIDAMISAADALLYQAKQSGRDQVVAD